MVDFLLVDLPSAYNAIIGQPTLNALCVVVSTYHLAMKFPAGDLVREVRGDQTDARQCYAMSTMVTDRQKAINTVSHLEGPHPEQYFPHTRRAWSIGKDKGKKRRSR